MKSSKSKAHSDHHSDPAKPSSRSPGTPLIIFLALLAVILGVLIIANRQGIDVLTLISKPLELDQSGKPGETGTPSLSPTPFPIAQGPVTYSFSWGEGTTVPRMVKFDVDPHDAAAGQKQTVTVHFAHTASIDSVELQLTTDTQKNTFPLARSGGTGGDSIWTGSYTMPESHEYTYIFTPVVTAGGTKTPYKTVIRELP